MGAISYALDVKPGGRPLFIMGTTHVISNCLDAPDLRSQALQRADVRPGQWLINGVINGGDALALGAKMLDVATMASGGLEIRSSFVVVSSAESRPRSVSATRSTGSRVLVRMKCI